jgi:hypothetical protein
VHKSNLPSGARGLKLQGGASRAISAGVNRRAAGKGLNHVDQAHGGLSLFVRLNRFADEPEPEPEAWAKAKREDKRLK